MDTKKTATTKKEQSRIGLPHLILFTVLLVGVFIVGYKQTNNKYVQPIGPFVVSTPSVTLAPSPTITPTAQTTAKTIYIKPTAGGQALPVLHGGVIFGLINQYRNSKGEPFLSVSDELCSIAESRADYMMANNMAAFKTSSIGNHTGFKDVNYSGAGIGENLAANLTRDQDVIALWKSSPPHNELMLWTVKDGESITKGCVATRVSKVGSITVLEVGDK